MDYSILSPKNDRCIRELLIKECPFKTLYGTFLTLVISFILSLISSYKFISVIFLFIKFNNFQNKRYCLFLLICLISYSLSTFRISLHIISHGEFSFSKLFPITTSIPDFLYILLSQIIIYLIKPGKMFGYKLLKFILNIFLFFYSILVLLSILLILGIPNFFLIHSLNIMKYLRSFFLILRYFHFVYFIFLSQKAFIFNDNIIWVLPLKIINLMKGLIFFISIITIVQLIGYGILISETLTIFVSFNYLKYRTFYTNYISILNLLTLAIPGILLLWIVETMSSINLDNDSSSSSIKKNPLNIPLNKFTDN